MKFLYTILIIYILNEFVYLFVFVVLNLVFQEKWCYNYSHVLKTCTNWSGNRFHFLNLPEEFYIIFNAHVTEQFKEHIFLLYRYVILQVTLIFEKSRLWIRLRNRTVSNITQQHFYSWILYVNTISMYIENCNIVICKSFQVFSGDKPLG